MNTQLEHLIVLQAQDLELARLRAELAEAPKRVATQMAQLSTAEKAQAALAAQMTAEEKLRRGQESEIASHRSKLERLRRSLDGATSAQQVAAFEHEIHFAQTAIGTLEEAAFVSLERSEALELGEKDTAAAVGRAKAALAGERERAAALKTQNEVMVAGLERERAGLRGEIEAPRLALYDKLLKTRGTAVAEAIGTAIAGKCAACQMGVRPQRWQDLTGRDHLDEIFICESCGRMLFWDPRRDTPRPWAAGERLQAAQAGGRAVGAGGSR